MATIAVIIDDYFEDSEYIEPVKAFKDVGHRVVHLGVQQGKVVRGKKKRTEVTIDKGLKHVNPVQYDALLLPGGYSPDRLRAHPEAVAFAKGFVDLNKPVFAICQGPQLLIAAQRLKGKKVTGRRSIRQNIINAGAKFVDREVVEDGNLITSRQRSDIPYFINRSMAKLATIE